MKIYSFIFALLLTGFGSGLMGQDFLTPVSSLTGDATAVTQDGKEISGDIRTAVFGPRGLQSFTIRDASDTKHKFKAADVATLKVKVDGLAKLEMLSEKTTSLKRMLETDFDEIADREYLYYEQVQIPGKKKYVMAQLLNPGWDSKIKVFHNPLGSETQQVGIGGMTLAGGDAKTYIVVANDAPSIILKKKDYEDKIFDKIYSSCPDIGTNFQDNDRKFKYFASHVFAYDQGCE